MIDLIFILKDAKVYKYWTLEDTLSGFLVSQLTFCSANGNSTLSYTSCPNNCVLSNNPFWNAASRDFARKARNQVYVFLNSSMPSGAITHSSTFKTYEIPEFKTTNVKKINVYLIRTPNMTQIEACHNGTIKWLQETMDTRNIEFSCTEDSNAIYAYVCFENPDSNECSFFNNVFKNRPKSSRLFYMIIFLNYLIVIVICSCRAQGP